MHLAYYHMKLCCVHFSKVIFELHVMLIGMFLFRPKTWTYFNILSLCIHR